MDLDFTWHSRHQKLMVVDYWWREQHAVCCLCEDTDLLMDPYRGQHASNPLAATLEHLKPKRDGGPNTARNVRLAHRMCNSGLGSLWIENQLRIAEGLEPFPPELALTRAREKNAEIIAFRLRQTAAIRATIGDQPRLAVHASEIAFDILARSAPPGYFPRKAATIKWSMAASAGKSLPRGATLPGYVGDDDAPPPRQAIAPRVADLLDQKPRAGSRERKTPVCANCGSPQVSMDASLRWFSERQNWTHVERREVFDCEQCGDETTIRWVTASV